MDVTKVCARDLMNKNVKTVRESDSVTEVAKLMRDQKVSSVVVEPEGEGDAFGILTRKDMVEALDVGGLTGGVQVVAEIMTKPAIVLSPGLSIHHCVQMMRMVGVRRMPVLENGRLVGILSNSDVFARMVADIE